jgi:hypothetical protein
MCSHAGVRFLHFVAVEFTLVPVWGSQGSVHCAEFDSLFFVVAKMRNELMSRYYTVNNVWRNFGFQNLWSWCCHLYSSCSSVMQRLIIVLAYLCNQHTKFHSARWMRWFFKSFYLQSWCNLAMDPTKERYHILFKSWKKCNRDLLIIFKHQGDCSQMIHPGRLYSQFLIILWRFMATAWKWRRLRPELWRQRSWLLHHDNSLSHTSFFTGNSWPKTTWLSPPTPPYFSLFPWLKIKPKGR